MTVCVCVSVCMLVSHNKSSECIYYTRLCIVVAMPKYYILALFIWYHRIFVDENNIHTQTSRLPCVGIESCTRSLSLSHSLSMPMEWIYTCST